MKIFYKVAQTLFFFIRSTCLLFFHLTENSLVLGVLAQFKS